MGDLAVIVTASTGLCVPTTHANGTGLFTRTIWPSPGPDTAIGRGYSSRIYRETFGRWYEELADSHRARWEVRNAQFPLTPWRRFTEVRQGVADLFRDQLQCARDDYRVEDWAIRGRAEFPLNPRNTAEILELEIHNKACDWLTCRLNVRLVAVRLGQLEIYRTSTTGNPLNLRSLVIQHEDNDSHFDRPHLHPAGSPRQFNQFWVSSGVRTDSDIKITLT